MTSTSGLPHPILEGFSWQYDPLPSSMPSSSEFFSSRPSVHCHTKQPTQGSAMEDQPITQEAGVVNRINSESWRSNEQWSTCVERCARVTCGTHPFAFAHTCLNDDTYCLLVSRCEKHLSGIAYHTRWYALYIENRHLNDVRVCCRCLVNLLLAVLELRRGLVSEKRTCACVLLQRRSSGNQFLYVSRDKLFIKSLRKQHSMRSTMTAVSPLTLQGNSSCLTNATGEEKNKHPFDKAMKAVRGGKFEGIRWALLRCHCRAFHPALHVRQWR
eukprot:6459302-Amphidinium_carterae.2